MKNGILFSERQKFDQWWIWLVILSFDAMYIFAIVQQVFLGVQFGKNPADDIALIIALAVLLIITFLFYSIRLDTEISADGIKVRFFPFHLSFRIYPWEKIRNCYVRKYKPIREYGGWGLRGLGSNRALNVKGNMGIQVEFIDGKKLLIGTGRFDEVSKILTSLK